VVAGLGGITCIDAGWVTFDRMFAHASSVKRNKQKIFSTKAISFGVGFSFFPALAS
jgi:hypothetical protein